jgi:hypothetical protein
MKTRKFYQSLFLLALLLVAGGKMYGQQIVYEPYDFRQVNADGDTLYYRITSDSEPYTVAVTRCHDSTYHQLPVPQYFYQVGQPGFAYPVYDYDSLINIPSTVTHDDVTYTVTAIDIEAFYYQRGLCVVNLPPTIETIDSGAFYLSSLAEITLQEGLQRINSSAFTSTGIRGVYLPQSVSHIGIGVFASCKQLQNIAIPSNITKISWGSFMRCDSLNHVELPDGVDTIEAYAFYSTHSLSEITIPSQVRYIGESAFNAAYVGDKLFISIKCQVPPALEYHSIADYDSLTFEVPCGTLEAYQNAWQPDLDLYVANSVTFIEDCNAVEEYADAGIRVYPNPASDFLYIEGDFDMGSQVFIYDMTGRIVETVELTSNNTELNISYLPEGYYIVRIGDGNGKLHGIKVCKKR